MTVSLNQATSITLFFALAIATVTAANAQTEEETTWVTRHPAYLLQKPITATWPTANGVPLKLPKEFSNSATNVMPSMFGISEFCNANGNNKQLNSDEVSGQKIKVEAHTLTVDSDTFEKINKLVGADLIEANIGAMQQPESRPIQIGQIDSEAFKKIQALAANQMRELPGTTIGEAQVATTFDGTIASFMTSCTPSVTATEVHSVPMIQPIEVGDILRQQAIITDRGIQLAVEFVHNRISNVDEYTFDGSVVPFTSTGNKTDKETTNQKAETSVNGITIQIPTVQNLMAKCKATLQPGQLLFLNPNLQELPKQQKQKFAGRFEENSKAKSQKLFIFSAKLTK